jgi:hypothetical protein
MDSNQSKALRDAFMRHALVQIMAGYPPGTTHPLIFLVDLSTRNWKARQLYTLDPTVQAGHLTSRHSGEPERLALEDSMFNQMSSHVGESKGAIFFKSAVLIGNVPVELRTARMWERLGALPQGTVDIAAVSSGWTR